MVVNGGIHDNRPAVFFAALVFARAAQTTSLRVAVLETFGTKNLFKSANAMSSPSLFENRGRTAMSYRIAFKKLEQILCLSSSEI